MSTHPARTALAGFWRPGLVALAALTSGCTWISSADYADAVKTLDQDGDGISSDDGDCDDADGTVFPGAEETWYDGIDADCAGDDDFDADKDGWVPAEHEGVPTANVAGTGGLRGGDCNDDDPTINPTAVDDWYDGVDTDCAGNDDNDADSDGYAAVEHGGDDCFDGDASVNPGATEVWLDGVDSDCSGGSDYDEDGDGYAPMGLGNRTTLYAPDAPVVPDGDCDDTDPDVNTASTEVYYDGKDNDCDPLTADLDQDADGFELGGSTEEDCDDEDASVYPGAEEVVGDDTDHDCDGGNSTFVDAALVESGPLFDPTGTVDITDLQEVHIGAGPSHLWFAIGASELTLPLASGEETAVDSIVAFGVPLDDSSRGIVRRQYLVYHPATPQGYAMGDHFGFYATAAPGSGGTNADLLLVAHGMVIDGTDHALRIAGYNERTDQLLGAYAEFTGSATYDDLALVLGNNDRVHAVGCIDGGALDIVSGDLSLGTGEDLTTGFLRTDTSLAGEGAASCAIDAHDDPNISVVLADGAAASTRVSYARDAPATSLSLEETFTGITGVHADNAEGGTDRAVVLVDTSGTVHIADSDGTVSLSGITAEGRARALVTGDTRGTASPDYVLSGVQPDGTAWFAVGNNDTGYTSYDLVPSDGGTVTDAVAWLDDSGRLHSFVVSDGALRYGSALF